MRKTSAAAGLLVLLAGCAVPTRPGMHVELLADIPAALMPPATQEPYLSYPATGVQIYECAPRADAPGRYAWQFRAPEASLPDGSGREVIHHDAGPRWQAQDGSWIAGRVSASAPAPVPGAIPWLLLSVPTRRGPGVLADAVSVQRLHTNGGVAPAAGCSDADAGRMERVPYSATYVFWRARMH